MSKAEVGRPKKLSLTMRNVLEQRGIDLVEMQLQVYNKAMKAFDSMRGYGEKGDAGPQYLAQANAAIALLAKHSYPTMTAIGVHDASGPKLADGLVDAAKIREIILNDPFALDPDEKVARIMDDPGKTHGGVLPGRPLEPQEPKKPFNPIDNLKKRWDDEDDED